MWKKCFTLFIIIVFLLHADLNLLAQSNDEIQNQFMRAAESYKKGQKVNALKRLEGIVGIILEKNMDLKDILGRSFLLMGAIYEKDAVYDLAVENYKRAVTECNITRVQGIDFSGLPLYKKHVLPKIIQQEGTKVKKKFPWFLVVTGVLLVGVTIYILVKKSKKYTLTVNMTEGVTGIPSAGSHAYRKGETVPYSFSAQNGYGNLTVLLDGTVTTAADSVTMNKNHTLTVSAEMVGFVTDRNELDVPENGTAGFTFWLSARPQNTVSVTVNNVLDVVDDPDIQVASGPAFAFSPDNWNIPQTVLLRAVSDDDVLNGQATIRIRDLGNQIQDTTILAREIDNDSLGLETNVNEVVVAENGSTQFRVRLIAAPSASVTANVSWLSGDRTVVVQSPPGGNMVFDAGNWDEYQTVTLSAGDDADTVNGQAFFRVTAPDMPAKDIKVYINDDDALHLIVVPDSLEINEGGSGTIQVKFSAAPTGTITVATSRFSGSTDVSVTPQSLAFDATNWNDFQDITVTAAEDEDALDEESVIRVSADTMFLQDVTVTVKDNDDLRFETDVDTVSVPEEGSATFQVRLTAQPANTITATVARFSGDLDIGVSSNEPLTFTTSDWRIYQTVTLVAEKDEDREEEPNKNGETTIRIVSNSVGQPKDIIATEIDNGPGDVPEVSISSPAEGQNVYDDITINALASDFFGIRKVEFYIDNELLETAETYPYRCIWSTLNEPLGTREIKAVAYDWANQIATDTIMVTLIDSPPIVTDLHTTPNTSPLSGTITVNIAARDYKGVQSVRFYVDDVLVATKNNSPAKEVTFNVSLDTTTYSPGGHIFKAIAVDTEIQESAPVQISVTITN